MIAIFLTLLGFIIVFPFGDFLSWPKKIIFSLSLSIAIFDFDLSEFFFINLHLVNIASWGIYFFVGAVIALPFVATLQMIEAVIETLEIIRGVNLSSVLSPLSQQNEMPLVSIVNIVTISFVFLGSELFIHALELIFKVTVQNQAHNLINLKDLVYNLASTFSLYPQFFVAVTLMMLTSDLVMQAIQKIFPLLALQDMALFLRTTNAVVFILMLAPDYKQIAISITKPFFNLE